MLSKQQNWYPSSFYVTDFPPFLALDFHGSSCFSGREQSRTPKWLQIDNFEVQYNRSGLSERKKNLHNYSEQQKVSKNRKTAEPVGAL